MTLQSARRLAVFGAALETADERHTERLRDCNRLRDLLRSRAQLRFEHRRGRANGSHAQFNPNACLRRVIAHLLQMLGLGSAQEPQLAEEANLGAQLGTVIERLKW